MRAGAAPLQKVSVPESPSAWTMPGSKPRAAAPEAALALERHRRSLEAYLKEWGLALEALVMDFADADKQEVPTSSLSLANCPWSSCQAVPDVHASGDTPWPGVSADAAALGHSTGHIPIMGSRQVAPKRADDGVSTGADNGSSTEDASTARPTTAQDRPDDHPGDRAAAAAAAVALVPALKMVEEPGRYESEPAGSAAPMTERCPSNRSSGADEVESHGVFNADHHMAKMFGFRSNHGDGRTCLYGLEMIILEPPQPRPGAFGCVARCVASQAFEAMAALIIVVNAVYIAYASDMEMRRVTEGGHDIPASFWLELGFTSWYAAELAARLYVYGKSLYMCEDWKWNVFDTILVMVSLQDLIASAGNASPSFLRIMRLARMMKLLRVIRLLRMFRELRLILNAILGCMKSMFWAMILIVNVSFIFGLCFLQATTEYLKDEGDDIDPQYRRELLRYWGGVGASMYSLYSAALGGIDWDVQAHTLKDVGVLFWLLYLLFVGFFFCVITNTLTSLFVEATMINAEKDKEQIIQDELDHKEVYIQKLQKLFLRIGGGRGQRVTMDRFMEHIQHPDMIYFAATIGIETVDLKQFFKILSDNGRQAVDVEAFVVGCIKLKGAAKSMDLMDMKISLKRENSELRKGMRGIERTVVAVARAVGVDHPMLIPRGTISNLGDFKSIEEDMF